MNLVSRQPGPRQHNPDGVPVRLQELLADRVMLGESAMEPEELEELEALERQFPAEAERAELELGRTVVQAGMSPSQRRYLAAAGAVPATMPTTLRRSLARDASLVLSGTVAVSGGAAMTAGSATTATAIGTWSWKTIAMISWVVAGGAIVTSGVLVDNVWTTGGDVSLPAAVANGSMAYDEGSSPATLSYQAVKARDAKRYDLAPATAPATESVNALEGYVIWSQELLAGVLHVSNLPVNDPEAQQFQAWIIDTTRPEGAQHVDAGVFDINEDQSIHTVALRAKLPVGQAGGIVVTAEPVGGSAAFTADSRVVLLTGTR